jgi:long-subunit fatty acid transport protein
VGYGFTAGILFTVPYGLGASWDLFDPPPGFEPGESFPVYDHESDLSIYSFQPTVAYSITPTLSVGAGLGILYGDMLLRKVKLQDTGGLSDYSLPIDSTLRGTGFSFIGNFGVHFYPYRRFSIGLNIVSGTKIPLEGDAVLDYYIPKDMRDNYGYPAVLESDAKGKADLPIPWRYGAGICYRPLDSVWLTMDVEYVRWSSVDEITIDLEGYDPLIFAPYPDEYIVKHWDDTVRISSGTEIEITPEFFLLGGYYHESAATPMETIDPLVTSFGDLNAVTIGGAIKKQRMDLNVLYEMHYFSTTTVKEFGDLNNDGIYDNLPGKYSGAVHVANLNVNVYF